MTNAQPPLLLVAGLPLPKSDELPDRPLEGGATPDGSPEAPLAAGAGLAGAGAWDVAGTTLVGAGAGTDDICETCETWETWLPVPDTWDEWDEWLTCPSMPAGIWPFTARSGNATTLAASSRLPAKSDAACAGDAAIATAVTAAASGRIGDLGTPGT
jgi:hypothetical protein